MVTVLGFVLSLLAPASGDDAFSPDAAAAVRQKLESIVVSVDFNKATIGEAILALGILSRQADRDHRGIGFVMQPSVSELGQPVTLKLDNVPVGVALHYVCELGRIRYKVDGHFVSVVPLGGGCGMEQRTFHVDPSFVGILSKAGVIPSAQTP
ncbi:MAG: hypothetical protein WDO13_13305 [Verrucomicrobiota bacterium]